MTGLWVKQATLGFALALLVSAGTISVREQAESLYQRTDYQAAVNLLNRVGQKDAATYNLLGRSYYGLADYKKATESLERAAAMEPNNSSHYLWLGRAYGRRAETSSFITAPGFAKKTCTNFERSVALDPRSLDALNDLFEYYLQAPGFLGGGFDKASALAEKVRALDPVEYHFTQARLAEKRKEFNTAEAQLRRAVDLAPRQVGRVIDLAKFLSKQGRYQESDATFQRAQKIAPQNPKLLFEQAATYIETNRNLDTARALLKLYLQVALTPDDPPRQEAERLLKDSSGG
ncbi:MAG: tetratricopeptide repeat protein [Acidobacteriales bacterium]|nr:tetratricopeptide repeat protein [Terriglobales bacterium]